MSYINDALRKVQKEKESRYAAYEQIVSAPGKRIDRSRKWLSIIAILMVFFWAVGIIALLYWPEDTKVPLIRRISAPPVASVVVAGQKPDNNTTVELQPPEKTAQVRTKQDIAKAKALFAQALERQREGKLKEAKELYQKVVKIDQDNVQAFNNLGVIDMGEKKYKRAIMRFNEALNIKHDYPDAHYNLACLYAQKHDVSRSLLYLKNAIEFNPEVRKWAKNDGDLKDLTDLPAFKKLFGETIKLR